ncbi:phage late control protein GPD [compost metagenome]
MAHSFSPEAYTTSLDLSSKLPDDEELWSDEQVGQFTGIYAWYRDEKTGKQHTLTAGDQKNPRRLTHLYASKASAERAVEREWKRMQAAQA